MNKIIGIYKIQSISKPNKIYIGSSINIKNRWSRHSVDLKGNRHENYKLQRHYNKYGKDDLVFEILEECNKEDILKIEQIYLDTLNPKFNICRIAGTYKGVKQTKKSLNKRKGRTSWNKGLKGKDNPMTGNKHCSEETKKKLSELFKGKPSNRKGVVLSEETRQKISNAKKGQVAWNKGLKTGAKSSSQFKKGHTPWNKGLPRELNPSTGTKRKK